MIKELETNKKIGLNPFAGVYLSTLRCLQCGPANETHRWEVFYDLSLELRTTLQESLNEFFKPEQIDDYTCIRCSIREYLKGYSDHVT